MQPSCSTSKFLANVPCFNIVRASNAEVANSFTQGKIKTNVFI